MRTTVSKVVYSLMVVGAITVLGVALYVEKIETKDVGTGLLALLGTLLGATLAFRLNEDKEARKEQAARRAALNRALFVIARQKNAVTVIARELEPFKTDFERAFNFPPVKVPPYADLMHRFEELEFLLETKDINTILRLTIEQERFHQMLECLRTRNEFYVNELQKEIARLHLNGREFSGEAVAELLGERLFRTAMNASEVLRHHVETCAKSLPEMLSELRSVAKRIYPKHQFVGFKE